MAASIQPAPGQINKIQLEPRLPHLQPEAKKKARAHHVPGFFLGRESPRVQRFSGECSSNVQQTF